MKEPTYRHECSSTLSHLRAKIRHFPPSRSGFEAPVPPRLGNQIYSFIPVYRRPWTPPPGCRQNLVPVTLWTAQSHEFFFHPDPARPGIASQIDLSSPPSPLVCWIVAKSLEVLAQSTAGVRRTANRQNPVCLYAQTESSSYGCGLFCGIVPSCRQVHGPPTLRDHDC